MIAPRRWPILLLLLPLASPADPGALDAADREALALGRKVLAVQTALADPEAPDALAAISALGLDSRHYTMVRGWLMQQLLGDLSIAEANPQAIPPKIERRIEFLQRAIRAIDLE